MTVNVVAQPEVEVGLGSRALTVAASMPWNDLPIVGLPRADPEEVLYVTSVDLVSKSRVAASVSQARALDLVGPDGVRLPEDSLIAVEPLPTVAAGEAESLTVQLVGRNFRAGEYSGRLRIVLAGAPLAPLEIPVTLRLKDGVFMPFVVLVLGLLAGGFLGWWRSEGKETLDVLEDIQRLKEKIQTAGLPQAERKEAVAKLRLAGQAITADEDPSVAKERLAAAESFFQEQKEALEQTRQALDHLRNDSRQIPHGTSARDALLTEIDQLEARLRQGKFHRLEEAEFEMGELHRKCHSLESLIQQARKKLDEDKDLRDRVDRAANPEAIASVLEDDGDVDFMPGAPLVQWILYTFALVVGWITFYASSPTFGARVEEYVPLFFWGAAVESSRGKIVDMSGLKAIYTEEVEKGEPSS